MPHGLATISARRDHKCDSDISVGNEDQIVLYPHCEEDNKEVVDGEIVLRSVLVDDDPFKS